MYSHAPKDYTCPICIGIHVGENEKTLIRKTDIIYRDHHVTALVNSFFIQGNEGHVIVVPNNHYENLYDLPEEIGHGVFNVSKKIAAALKRSYHCNGVTVLQNNEPASEQHAFHYHMHIIPRYTNDEFHKNRLVKLTPTAEERKIYADTLKRGI